MRRLPLALLCCLTMCSLILFAVPALADVEIDDAAYEKAMKQMVEKNVFAPFKPKPKPVVRKPKKREKPKPPPKKVDVYEDLVVTGFLWDDRKDKQRFIAFVETRDGQKILELVHGDTVGKFTVKVVMQDKLVLTDKGGKATEVSLGGTFKGDVIGSTTSYGSSSSSSITRTSKTKKPEKALPKLSDTKKMSIIERLKAKRAAQMRKKKGKK